MNKDLKITIYDIVNEIDQYLPEQSTSCWEEFVKWSYFQFES